MITSIYSIAWPTLPSIRKRVKARRDAASTRRRMRDILPADLEIIEKVKPYTMIAPERLHAFMEATRYVVKNTIPGDIVECGVWKGGAAMASIHTLQSLGVTDREVYLYDTFEGMSLPTQHDRKLDGTSAAGEFQQRRIDDNRSHWCRAEYDDVRNAVLGTGYDAGRIHFVKGRVEDTIPKTMPEEIAVLRLDTDWYESTKHELEHLFPRLLRGGVLILDDYGHWLGARKAVDEYFESHAIPMLLNRSDYTGRVGVKL